jgi:hypothetical protein
MGGDGGCVEDFVVLLCVGLGGYDTRLFIIVHLFS